MKTYISLIKLTQLILLGVSIGILALLPGVLIFYPDFSNLNWLYFLAHTSLFFVMVIRPLADIFPQIPTIRPLVILRKGVGVFSAAIIVSFILAKIIVDPVAYVTSISSPAYWTLENLTLFAHLADLSAVLLLITSNKLSKRLLGASWKAIQRLSYVYFYGSVLYVVFILQDYVVAVYLIIVTIVTILAYRINREKRAMALSK
jgi:DMSO/TMAO reductase YedYZ heme-binding membrane subunit